MARSCLERTSLGHLLFTRALRVAGHEAHDVVVVNYRAGEEHKLEVELVYIGAPIMPLKPKAADKTS